FSTEINNPSYVLTGAVLFFVGVYELTPALRCEIIPHRVAGLMVGFGLLWVYQLHLSFVLMIPILGAAFILLARRSRPLAATNALWCALGAAIPGVTLLPTLVKCGPAGVGRGTGASVTMDWTHLLRLPEVVARYLSFASFEAPRFVGAGTEARLLFLAEHWWAAPFVVFATLCGIAQALYLFLGFFRREGPPEWPAGKTVTLLVLVFIYLSFVSPRESPR